eukprot:GEZU01018295.1.p1 GENE.GEZU01018295.1~~GEZU01018295.1.p1  ORF type:complete len:101 (-),score=1.08 GEZU01018295.1:127-429(-)
MTMNSFLSSSVSTKSCTSRTNRDLVSDPYRIRDDGGASNHETTCHSLQDLSDDVLFFIFSFLRLAEFENLRMVRYVPHIRPTFPKALTTLDRASVSNIRR